jgi:hypothetical protein
MVVEEEEEEETRRLLDAGLEVDLTRLCKRLQ